MKPKYSIIVISFLLLCPTVLSQIKYEDYFLDKALRIDYFHTGDKNTDSYSIDELIEEPAWGGTKTNLIFPFNYGTYVVKVFDQESNQLIYTYNHSTIFSEWQTTDEAVSTVKSFNETFRMPFPKKPVRIEFYSRDKKTNPVKKFEYKIDPANYFIKKENRHKYNTFEVLDSGSPEKKVDIVLIPEGYTKEQMEQFKQDCRDFEKYLFNATPFKENKDKFNIRGVEAPSLESGSDIPKENVWKSTIVNSHFYTFDLDRYCMTYDNKSVRDIAANAPYDQIYILVNSDKYGGGAIYNHYSLSVSNSPYEEYIYTHEFGHGFAFLADEYYDSEVAYNEFYPLDVEPLEMNLTTLVDFDSKWKNMLGPDTKIPTPKSDNNKDSLGVFEGGGYAAKGIFRPEQDCTMKSVSVNNFCEVCKIAIQKMIDFYTD